MKAPGWQMFGDLLDQSVDLVKGPDTYRIANAATLELDAPDTGGPDAGRYVGEFWELVLPAAQLPPGVSPEPRDKIVMADGSSLVVEQATRFGELWRVRCVRSGAARR